MKCKHKYLFQNNKELLEETRDYACMKCGLNWRFDPKMKKYLAGRFIPTPQYEEALNL